MIKNAIIIDDSTTEGEVSLNNTVTFKYVDDDEEETVKIVTSIRGNTVDGRISNESPIGKALLGHKVGDVCEVELPNGGSYEIKITALDQTTGDDDSIRTY